jgi:hypothetical protein
VEGPPASGGLIVRARPAHVGQHTYCNIWRLALASWHREVIQLAKKLATTVYITDLQQQLLKELNRRSKVPVAEYIREGIDLVLEKHRDLLPGQLELNALLPGVTKEAGR